MAGIVYNGLRPLDLAHDKSDRTKIRGSVKTLTSIPYDYKDKNPGLFVDTGVQSTAELYSHDGSGKFMNIQLRNIWGWDETHILSNSDHIFIMRTIFQLLEIEKNL